MKKTSDVEETLIKSAMLNLGIVPYTNAFDNIGTMLSNSSPEEKQKMQRKFRKIWKKFDKILSKKSNKINVDIIKSKSPPTLQEKRRRKQIVLSHIQNTLVKPLIESMTKLKSK